MGPCGHRRSERDGKSADIFFPSAVRKKIPSRRRLKSNPETGNAVAVKVVFPFGTHGKFRETVPLSGTGGSRFTVEIFRLTAREGKRRPQQQQKQQQEGVDCGAPFRSRSDRRRPRWNRFHRSRPEPALGCVCVATTVCGKQQQNQQLQSAKLGLSWLN